MIISNKFVNLTLYLSHLVLPFLYLVLIFENNKKVHVDQNYLIYKVTKIKKNMHMLELIKLEFNHKTLII